MPDKEFEFVKSTVAIIDSINYNRYSEGRANNYLEYASGSWVDESKLVDPIMFPKFLEQILGFKLGESVGTQESLPDIGDTPDYIPTDTRTHPFLFDCKGMDTHKLSKYLPQIQRYIKNENVTYGVLINMRDLGVYTIDSNNEVDAFSFSFIELYNEFKSNPANVLDQPVTKRFLRFVESFHFTPLSIEQKLNRTLNARQWLGTELLNINLLTQRLHHVIETIYRDVSLRKEGLLPLKDN
jgi:hypothetical protein